MTWASSLREPPGWKSIKQLSLRFSAPPTMYLLLQILIVFSNRKALLGHWNELFTELILKRLKCF